MKPTVYIETTIPSYLTARPSKNVIRAAREKITRSWWKRRKAFDLFVSRLVLLESQRGYSTAVAKRMKAMENIPILEQIEEAEILADQLTIRGPLPAKAASDAMHIAIAAVFRVQYLLTWNCKHIANVRSRSRIESICRSRGFEPPLICTPDELTLSEDDL